MGNMKRGAVFLSFILTVSALAGLLHIGSMNVAGTDISGTISTDTTWDLAGSPYIIIGDVTVMNGITLTIDPGVQVKFDGYHSIFVDGTLIAIGTDTNRINITSNKTTPLPGDWDRIQIDFAGHAEIMYSNISYGDLGIYLLSSSYNNVTNNNVSNNWWSGIYLDSSSNNTITNNNVSNNVCGIYIEKSSYNNISNNNVSNNDYGFYLDESSNNYMTNNSFVNDGVLISGSGLSHFNTHYIPDNNTVNGKPLYYYKDNECNGTDIDGVSIGQLILANCTNVNVKNLQISNTDVGIEVGFSTSSLITSNNVSSNGVLGIYLSHSLNIDVTQNDVLENGEDGIFLYSSSNSNITQNNVSNNGDDGIHLYFLSNNIIAANNITLNNANGIRTLFSSNNNITQNNVSENGYDGIDLYSSSNNDITQNSVSINNGTGIIITESSDNIMYNNTVSNNSVGIELFGDDTNTNTITSSRIFGNQKGIYVNNPSVVMTTGSSDHILSNNVIYDNVEGISLQVVNAGLINEVDISSSVIYNNDIGIESSGGRIGNITISNCTIRENRIGIQMYGPDWNEIVDNDISDNNEYAIHLSNSEYDLIHHNNFIDNGGGLQAYDDTGLNFWNNTYPSGGNYWSNYDAIVEGCTDDYSGATTPQTAGTPDGLCDLQYNIDANSADYYPFVYPLPIDGTPPAIMDMQPPHESTTSDNTPVISADYSDTWGIDNSSVLLKVDGVDVTSIAQINTSVAKYMPISGLANGLHTVYLEVRDINGNLAAISWSFNIDTKAPTIINVYLEPPDESTTNDNTPTITAAYNDLSGIDTDGIVMRVDGKNVTSSATVNANAITYTPIIALSDGPHIVYLQVKDTYGNIVKTSWTFYIETIEPPPESEEFRWWPMVIVIIFALILLRLLVNTGKRKPEKAPLETEPEEIEFEPENVA